MVQPHGRLDRADHHRRDGAPTTPAPASAGPTGIAAGPDGALWFTNDGNNSIGRITTAGTVTNYTGTGISDPDGIAAGPDGALWFTNTGNNSIGRITTTGAVTNYTGTGISGPHGITAGPDGALWFTNAGNNSIGRITTAGAVTNYTGTGITDPCGIAAGPDGALWFTNYGNNSIGRITTAGAVTNYTGTGITGPAAIAAGPGRGAVVHQHRQQLDRADHHRRDGHQLHRHRHRRARRDHRRARRRAVVHQLPATTRSGGSPPPGRSPTTPAPASSGPRGSRPGPTGRCGSPTHARQLDRADHHRRGGHQLHRHRHHEPGRDRGRARRGAVVHQLRQQLDRADHHRRGRSPTTPAPASASPDGIAAGPDGALWFTNDGNNSIGRITTAGMVTNYTGPGITAPLAITAGPDGALWFDNDNPQRLDRADHHRRAGDHLRRRHALPERDRGRARRGAVVHRFTGQIGRITTAGHVTNYTGVGEQHLRDRGRARRGHVVHQQRPQRLDRADHHRREGDHTTPVQATTRSRSRPGPTGPCGSPTTKSAGSGGSPHTDPTHRNQPPGQQRTRHTRPGTPHATGCPRPHHRR